MKKGQNPKNLSHIYIRNKKICIVGLICVAKISKLGYMKINKKKLQNNLQNNKILSIILMLVKAKFVNTFLITVVFVKYF